MVGTRGGSILSPGDPHVGCELRNKAHERYHCVKRQICGNIKMAFFFKLSYSKVRAFFT